GQRVLRGAPEAHAGQLKKPARRPARPAVPRYVYADQRITTGNGGMSVDARTVASYDRLTADDPAGSRAPGLAYVFLTAFPPGPTRASCFRLAPSAPHPTRTPWSQQGGEPACRGRASRRRRPAGMNPRAQAIEGGGRNEMPDWNSKIIEEFRANDGKVG